MIILSVVTASVVNTCLYLDMHQGGVLEILLCKVSSPCIISSMVASFALVELYKYRNAAGRRRILDLTRQCLDLSKAVHSLHATHSLPLAHSPSYKELVSFIAGKILLLRQRLRRRSELAYRYLRVLLVKLFMLSSEQL